MLIMKEKQNNNNNMQVPVNRLNVADPRRDQNVPWKQLRVLTLLAIHALDYCLASRGHVGSMGCLASVVWHCIKRARFCRKLSKDHLGCISL